MKGYRDIVLEIFVVLLLGVFVFMFFNSLSEKNAVKMAPPKPKYCLAIPFPNINNCDNFESKGACLNFLSEYINGCLDCCQSRSDPLACEVECVNYLNGPGSDYCNSCFSLKPNAPEPGGNGNPFGWLFRT